MSHLFLFTITPVQSFISQARKTQDLWAGSRILSDLIKAVIEKIGKEKVIFPYVANRNLEGIESLSNRVLAKFELPESYDFKALGNQIASVVQTKLDEYSDKAKIKIGEDQFNEKIESSFKAQLKDYFSTFWVFVPIENGDYEAAYDKANRLIGGIKNSRTYNQYPEQGRKCSLSGEQNALVFGKTKDLPAFTYEKLVDGTKKPLVAQIESDQLNEGEGLSAISFIKRFYPFNDKKKQFESTADISLLWAFQELFKVQDSQSTQFLNEMAISLNQKVVNDVDGQLFYEENLTKQYFQKHKIPEGMLNCAQEKLRSIKRIAKDNKIAFAKYYAILVFDADSMGAWLSGEYLTEESKLKLEVFQKHLSGLLLDYADYAKNYVDGNLTEKDRERNPDLTEKDFIKKGKTVYAGGDDYMGFINLHYLFDVLQHLREQFRIQVSVKVTGNSEFELKEPNKELAFSAGISIAHYKTPLSEVLKWARSMEHEAKDIEGKNAFGIAVLKHSGEIHKTVLGFKYENNMNLANSLIEIIRMLDSDFSSTFIKNTQKQSELLGIEKIDFDLFDIIQFELNRQITRAKNHKEAPARTMFNNVEKILVFSQNKFEDKKQIENFHSTLNICDFINRKLNSNE